MNGKMNENQWLHWVENQTRHHRKWWKGLGIGDDATHFPPSKGKNLVMCGDVLVEDVHFLREQIFAKDLGWKSLAVNLSDLAAMGARPLGSLLALSLPEELMGSWAKDFLQGFLELSDEYKTVLMGGDTTKSPQKIFISVTVVGEASPSKIKTRDLAEVDDWVCVTGPLGDSRAGLALQTANWKSSYGKSLLQRHHRPVPRVEMGRWLASRRTVHAMMDVSDGLSEDLSRLLFKSRVSARLEPEKVPLSSALRAYGKAFGKEPLWEAVLGGEDYELLFTCSPSGVERLRADFEKKFKTPFHILGRITKGDGEITWTDPNFTEKIRSASSFRHF